MAVKYADDLQQNITISEMVSRWTYEAVGFLEATYGRYEDWRERRAAASQLASMPEYLLSDIGVDRGDIRRVVGL